MLLLNVTQPRRRHLSPGPDLASICRCVGMVLAPTLAFSAKHLLLPVRAWLRSRLVVVVLVPMAGGPASMSQAR